ncbi:uncharacterized protein LOC131995072 [Stomoxys calcitrans]|uniref:uncharacterized protein LOC131995072 n=1 Tax=Stomoxys calcitrans TaxID=35570 RepID=UPI0027E23834|nr:uncharacterized protein LOC131995072 [Stomoxys calcitrans]
MHWTTKVSVFLVLATVFCHRSEAASNACTIACPATENPVCGTHRGNRGGLMTCTFKNSCTVKARECVNNEKWLFRQGRCEMENPDCAKLKTLSPVTTTAKPKGQGALDKTKTFFKDLFGKKN